MSSDRQRHALPWRVLTAYRGAIPALMSAWRCGQVTGTTWPPSGGTAAGGAGSTPAGSAHAPPSVLLGWFNARRSASDPAQPLDRRHWRSRSAPTRAERRLRWSKKTADTCRDDQATRRESARGGCAGSRRAGRRYSMFTVQVTSPWRRVRRRRRRRAYKGVRRLID